VAETGAETVTVAVAVTEAETVTVTVTVTEAETVTVTVGIVLVMWVLCCFVDGFLFLRDL